MFRYIQTDRRPTIIFIYHQLKVKKIHKVLQFWRVSWAAFVYCILSTSATKAPLGPLGFSTLWQLKACYVSEPDTFSQFAFQIQRISQLLVRVCIYERWWWADLLILVVIHPRPSWTLFKFTHQRPLSSPSNILIHSHPSHSSASVSSSSGMVTGLDDYHIHLWA